MRLIHYCNHISLILLNNMVGKIQVFSAIAILLVVESKAESCPPPELLDKCSCFVDMALRLPVLSCTFIKDWSDIAGIFDTGVVKRFNEVNIVYSMKLTEIPISAFANVEIDFLRIEYTGLRQLNRNVFNEAQENSMKTLTISHNSHFEHPEDDLTGISALQFLDLSFNNITSLKGEMTGKRPGISYLDLSHNNIKDIEPSYFAALKELKTIMLSFNELTTESLGIDTLTFYDGEEEFYLDLGHNSISEGLPMEALGGEVKPKGLILSHNNIQFLNESLFAPTLEAMIQSHGNQTTTYILLDGNDLECGCEMEWIIDHPGRASLQEGTCADGRLVSGLTEADFVDC